MKRKNIELPDTICQLLEDYSARWLPQIETIISQFSENGSYERGYKDAAFLIYTANNREDFAEIVREFFPQLDEDEGLKAVYQELERINNDTKGLIEEKLLEDCSRLSNLSEENLKQGIAQFMSEKVNSCLRENPTVQGYYDLLEQDYEQERQNVCMPSTSNSEISSDSDLPSNRSSNVRANRLNGAENKRTRI